MRRTPWPGTVLAVLVLGAGCAAAPTPPALVEVRSAPGVSTPLKPAAPPALPLSGHRIVIDPGHQLGNSRFPTQINRLVPAGGFTKACNTTGTATDGGYDEATFTWKVAQKVRRRLKALGARVSLTRQSNSLDAWGPCVDTRGRAGNPHAGTPGADLKISVHGDGSYAEGAHGFHVIYAPDRAPWTDDTYAASRRLALVTRAALERAGFERANYLAGGDGIDVRTDLGTLNLSDIPTVVVELGNMRDPSEARRMTSAAGQAAYAGALAAAVLAYPGKR